MKTALTITFLSLFLLVHTAAGTGESLFTHLWSGFSTSLHNRSQMQQHNAAQAAKLLNGIIIPPGARFSFNEVVGTRGSAKGYLEAPMLDSNGNLQDVPGGGICQLSTTIYNAALLAGLQIIERHPHSRTVGYVPPGRDATIASWRKDLKLANPHKTPLMLKVTQQDERLTAAFWSTTEKKFSVELRTEQHLIEPETAVIGNLHGEKAKAQQGAPGYSVTTRRAITLAGETRIEIISEDIYPPPSRLIGVGGP